jgi:hypothetical protein
MFYIMKGILSELWNSDVLCDPNFTILDPK